MFNQNAFEAASWQAFFSESTTTLKNHFIKPSDTGFSSLLPLERVDSFRFYGKRSASGIVFRELVRPHEHIGCHPRI
jgi:hypothetical protein